MPDRLAIKRLTASDLTFFETLFRTLDVGNQKSINLNADVFVEQLYPNLPDLITTLGDRIPISLTILGPSGAGPYVLARAITKREAYKNWRLNGEFVHDPDGEPHRFDDMSAGDIAVMDFAGEPGPQKLTLLLVSAMGDTQLHASLNPMVPGGRRTMARISRAELASGAAGVAPEHPVWLLAADPEYDAALEDVALGGAKGTDKLVAKVSKPVSAAALAAAKASAERNGRDGEALAWVYLSAQYAAGTMKSIEWVSQANAVSPFDFKVVDSSDASVRIDAKSTSGNFEWPIHMSLAELRTAAEGARYDIYRLYELDDDGACIRIATDIQATAKEILAGLKLPKGVTVDAVSIAPEIFKWSEEEVILRPDEDDAEEDEEEQD